MRYLNEEYCEECDLHDISMNIERPVVDESHWVSKYKNGGYGESVFLKRKHLKILYPTYLICAEEKVCGWLCFVESAVSYQNYYSISFVALVQRV